MGCANEHALSAIKDDIGMVLVDRYETQTVTHNIYSRTSTKRPPWGL